MSDPEQIMKDIEATRIPTRVTLPVEEENPYEENFIDHMHCKPGAPSHECSCFKSAPCYQCELCPSFDGDWKGWT